MFLCSKDKNKLFELFDRIGMQEKAKNANSAIIKVNLARPPEKGHPRTSPKLIMSTITYLSKFGISCAIAESTDGAANTLIKMHDIMRRGVTEKILDASKNVLEAVFPLKKPES